MNEILRKIKKYSFGLLIIVFAVTLFTLLFDIPTKYNGLGIYFVDVGQGDCILIRDGAYTFMIDGGGDRFMEEENNIGKRVVFPFLLDQGIDKIDCIFVTHVHFDHIKGVLEVLELIDVDTVVLPSVYYDYYSNYQDSLGEKDDTDSLSINLWKESIGSIKSTEEGENKAFVSSIFTGGDELFLLEELITICEVKDVELFFMKEDERVLGEQSKFTCLYPYDDKKYSEHENENSLVLLLELGGVAVMFTGDIEEEGEKWLINNKKFSTDIDILKVSHHGSNSSSSEAFLNVINPNIAIVSVGENLFGHPSDIVRMRYKNLNIPFYSTKKYGMIEIIVEEDLYKIVPYKGGPINEDIT